jgi:hypothetical protein
MNGNQKAIEPARFSPPPPRGGRTERHALSSPNASLASHETGGLSPMAFLVGVMVCPYRRSFLQRSPDCVEHAGNIAAHLRGGYAHDAVALGFEPAIAARIVRDLVGFRVLRAIDLDDEAPFETHEIDNVSANRMLSAEAHTIELPGAQGVPEPALRVAHGLAQGSRAFVGHEGG